MGRFAVSRSVIGGIRRAPDGSASAPAFSFGLDPNTGIYRVGADLVGIAAGAGTAATFGTSQINLNRNVVLANGSGTELLFSGDTQTDIKSEATIIIDFDSDGDGAGANFLEIRAHGSTRFKFHDSPSVVQQGGDSDTPTTWEYKAADALTNAVGSDLRVKAGQSAGTDKNGSSLHLAGGQCTGSGAAGPILFETATPGISGTTVRSLVERLRITDTALQFAEGINLLFGTTTGTKLGTGSTQKIGVWGNNPVIRPAAYTLTNHVASRSLNESTATVAQLANVVGTMISDFQSIGWFA